MLAPPVGAWLNVPPPYMKSGLLIGQDMDSGAPVYIDEYGARRDGRASSEVKVTGLKNFGKTAGMKWLAIAEMLLQAYSTRDELEEMRLHVDNNKPDESRVGTTSFAEWANVIEELGCTVCPLEQMSLNIFDGTVYRTDYQRLVTAVDMIDFQDSTGLPNDWKLAVRMAIASIRVRGIADDKLRLQHLEYALRHLCPADLKRFWQVHDQSNGLLATESDDGFDAQGAYGALDEASRRNADGLQDAARAAANKLMLIINGEYGATYAGRRQLSEYMKGSVLFDFSAASARAVEFFEMIRFSALRSMVERGDQSCIPHVSIREEVQEGAAVNSLVLRARAYWNAKARMSHMQTYESTQYPASLLYGEPGSTARFYAEQIFDGTDLFVMFRQNDDPLTRAILADRIRLTSHQIERVMRLPTGCALFKPKDEQGRFVQLDIVPSVKELIQSNRPVDRMVGNRQLVTDLLGTDRL